MSFKITDNFSSYRHGSEIATMALDLLSGAAMFVIPHRPKEPLLLRIGIHTGSVVAGVHVVSNSLPKYRIFGEAVDLTQKINLLGEGENIRPHCCMKQSNINELNDSLRVFFQG